MRRAMSERMEMNVSDIQALRSVVAGERSGHPATPRQISTELGISTASTTKLVDRLVSAGHIRRIPHPSDRRSVTLTATPNAHREIGNWLSAMHEQMGRVVRSFSPEELSHIERFLNEMSEVLDGEAAPSDRPS